LDAVARRLRERRSGDLAAAGRRNGAEFINRSDH
jgi:hypothetical protein